MSRELLPLEAGEQGADGAARTAARGAEAVGELDVEQLYLREVRRHRLLTPEEEVHYGRLARQGDPAARRRMIESNLRLVVKMARRYMNQGVPLLDLIEEGNLGLMQAVERFDPDKGFRFSTYASWWIRQAIERALISQAQTVRLPVHVAKAIRRYRRTARQLEALRRDGHAGPQEVARALGEDRRAVQDALDHEVKVESLDVAATPSNSHALVDNVVDESQDPVRSAQDESERRCLARWLQRLGAREREILARRFGLRDGEEATLEQVGREVGGISRERVRKIQQAALARLRAMAREAQALPAAE
ncbi:MAG: sigma-70 family RNA polymerase sigma factor [Gammaproteobacteria bacterium]|nr:MAG: sigma-70 family RNA polymerase sigma factor [Gammaproteobacteria bacterium]